MSGWMGDRWMRHGWGIDGGVSEWMDGGWMEG